MRKIHHCEIQSQSPKFDSQIVKDFGSKLNLTVVTCHVIQVKKSNVTYITKFNLSIDFETSQFCNHCKTSQNISVNKIFAD